MSRRTVPSLLAVAALGLALGLPAVGCRREEPTVGEKIEDAAEKAGDKIKEAGEEVRDEIDDL
jgi:hypothetical protein